MSSRPIIQTPSRLPERFFSDPLVDKNGLVRPNSVAGGFFRTLATPVQVQVLIPNTRAARGTVLAGNYPAGSEYYETDTTLYYASFNGSWIYKLGVWQLPQASLLGLTLGALDTGLLIYVTDYRHLLRWDGTALSWAPGELGSGFDIHFSADPNPVLGWQACDGSTDIAQLNPDGTLGFVTVPLTADNWFRQ